MKFLIFLVFLISPTFFLAEAFSLEIEFQPEIERARDALGWVMPDMISLQEQIHIVIDHENLKNKLTVGLLSMDKNDIIFPDYLEDIRLQPEILSFTMTNQFACAPTQIDRACIIIDVAKEGLGNSVKEIRDNTRKITDEIVSEGVATYAAEFYSVTLQKTVDLDGNPIIVARAVYTINKQPTEIMFDSLTKMFVSNTIRNSGGFYDYAEELTKNDFSEFGVRMIKMEDGMLRSVNVSVVCSDVLRELIRCPENVTNQITNGDISPLDLIQVENINRSKIFEDEFLPFNSIIQVTIYSKEDLQVKNVNTNLIEKLELGEIQDSGWFFASNSGKIIDGKFLFGKVHSVSKSDLAFSIGPDSGDAIMMNEGGGGCLIATAAFGSEMTPQVQFLREIRDNTVLQTESGTNFMAGFNQFYYSFSPAIADYERENPAFKEAVKLTIMPLLTSLTLLQYVDIDSESEMFGYGIGVILLNIGMYFIVPVILIIKTGNKITHIYQKMKL